MFELSRKTWNEFYEQKEASATHMEWLETDQTAQKFHVLFSDLGIG